MNRINISHLWARTLPDGRVVIGGRLGAANIQIEELAQPGERGETHALYFCERPDAAPKREEKRWVKQARGEAATVSPTGELAAYSSWCNSEKE